MDTFAAFLLIVFHRAYSLYIYLVMNQLAQKQRIRRCKIFTDSPQSTKLQIQDANLHNRLNYSLSYPLNDQTVYQGSKQNTRMTMNPNKSRLSESRHKIFSLRRSANNQSERSFSIERNSKAQSSYSQKDKHRHKIFEDWTKQGNQPCIINSKNKNQASPYANHNKNADIYTIDEIDELRDDFLAVGLKYGKKEEKRIVAGQGHHRIDANKSIQIMNPYQFEQLLKETRKTRLHRRRLMAQNLPNKTHKVQTQIPISPFLIYNAHQSSNNIGKQIYRI